jgi:hypothetical protein
MSTATGGGEPTGGGFIDLDQFDDVDPDDALATGAINEVQAMLRGSPAPQPTDAGWNALIHRAVTGEVERVHEELAADALGLGADLDEPFGAASVDVQPFGTGDAEAREEGGPFGGDERVDGAGSAGDPDDATRLDHEGVDDLAGGMGRTHDAASDDDWSSATIDAPTVFPHDDHDLHQDLPDHDEDLAGGEVLDHGDDSLDRGHDD